MRLLEWQEKRDEKTGETKRVPFTRYYTVFNVEQCEGVEYPEAPKPDPWFQPIERCELVEGCMPSPPNRKGGGTRAFYRPSTDTIHMPLPDFFDSAEDYYATLFHELLHSTGHGTRLARKGVLEDIVFGSHTYSKEELVAEMGATYLCAETFIENNVIENSVSYIAGWISRLKNDKRLLVQAGARAQKAVDYILTREDSAGV